jgi:tRNA-modifying protein YgfZ
VYLSVDLTKPYFPGREALGGLDGADVPHRLVFLHFDGSTHELPVPAEPVECSGRVVGRVTTPVLHHELGPVALAVLSATVEPGTRLFVGVTAASMEIPP